MKHLKGFYLLIIALLLSPLMVLGVVYSFIKFLCLLNIVKMLQKISDYSMSIAISIDQLGNVVMSDLFNDILIKDVPVRTWKTDLNEYVIRGKIRKHKFGNVDETISSVLGRNKLQTTLRVPGLILDSTLHALDKNHSEKSIERNLPND